jgi:hypothetical protein
MFRAFDENAPKEIASQNSTTEPRGKKEEGKTKGSWRGGVAEAMEGRGINAEDAQDGILWRRGLGRRQTAV